MRVRHAVPEDLGAVAEIQVAGWRWAYPGIISEAELQALDVGARLRRFQERFDPRLLFDKPEGDVAPMPQQLTDPTGDAS